MTVSSRKTSKQRRVDELVEMLRETDTLIMTELSRLGRSTAEVIALINALVNRNIRVIIIKQNLDIHCGAGFDLHVGSRDQSAADPTLRRFLALSEEELEAEITEVWKSVSPQILSQIDDGAASIERATGVRPILFRPPYGELDPWGAHLVRERGLELVLWSVEVGDMKREDPTEMAANLRHQIEYAGGGIVLLHDIRPASAIALEQLLTWLDEHRWDPAHPEQLGYEVVDLATYERATAASPQPYPSRSDLEAARSAAWRLEHPKSAPIAPKRLVEAASVAPAATR